ncbi:MAG: hypothetical protein ACPGU7_13440 [Gammaproteobacteria bacterium]
MNGLLAIAVPIAAIPVYGYFVHAARDPQYVALALVAAWLLTWVFLIGGFLASRDNGMTPRQTTQARHLSLYLLLMGGIGYGGVENAFYELIAG